ncbi:MAG: hypothetical protein QW117_02840 [Candidatus Pacearchaeota archaeon]
MITIQEIDEKLKTMSDFLKLEYLEEISKKQNSLEVNKYVRKKLAELYANKGMYSNAARHYEVLAELSVTFKEKIEAYLKEVEMWIKASDYVTADDILKRALSNANSSEKEKIKKTVKEMYKNQALFYEKRNERNKALKIYEKLYSIETDSNEKELLKNKLLELYEKTGKVREYMSLKEKK